MKQSLSMLVLWYGAFLFSMIFHEASHAFTALRLGDSTAAGSGQASLNPLAHIRREMTGMVFIPLASFLSAGWMIGWASAPYDPVWARQYPGRFAAMSLSGPLANLVLVLFVLLVVRVGHGTGVFIAPKSVGFSSVVAGDFTGLWSYLPVFLSILFSLNIMLFVFNMLPLPILDGSKLPLFFLSPPHSDRYLNIINNGKFMLATLVPAWFFFGPIHRPVRLFFINLLYPGVVYG